jgi:hypothetical protein
MLFPSVLHALRILPESKASFAVVVVSTVPSYFTMPTQRGYVAERELAMLAVPGTAA